MRSCFPIPLKLFNHDLIGFYRVDDGYPDLTDSDRSTIFRGISYWDKNHCDASLVGIFLTTAGEEIVLGHHRRPLTTGNRSG